MTDFIPRPARFTLTIEGVKVINIALENRTARAFNRSFKLLQQAVSPTMHVRDVVESIIAGLLLTAQEMRDAF